MKPVNLLPSAERPRAVAKAPAHASTAVLAVLGLLLLAMAGFVFTKNQIADRQNAITQANQEKAEAVQRSQGLQAFGDFSQIKQTRVQSITDLATKRFDWERLMRELALVLPQKVWVSELAGSGTGAATPSATGAPASGAAASTPSSGTSTPPTATAAPGATGGTPSLTIKGCAPSQKAVAESMVRLRNLYGAEEVKLTSSKRPEESAGSSASASSDSSGGGSTTEGCGRKFQFDALVTFKAIEATDKGKQLRAPSRLGGGA